MSLLPVSVSFSQENEETMINPVAITIVAGAAAENVTAGTAALEAAESMALIGGETAQTAVGGTTESFVGSLGLDPAGVGEMVLNRAEVSAGTLGNPYSQQAPFDAAQWETWRPPADERIGPESIADRGRPLRDGPNLSANLDVYIRHVEQRDPQFAQELSRRVEQFLEAKTPADNDKALQQLKRSTSGQLGEKISIDSLKPFFECFETQRRVETANGSTYIDVRFRDARGPVVFGRGHTVAQGGNLSVEVKTGQPAYLGRETRHIAERQVPGHLAEGDKSLVVVSGDVHGMAYERATRDAVSQAGSYCMALLPEKRVMDEALLRVVRERIQGARI